MVPDRACERANPGSQGTRRVASGPSQPECQHRSLRSQLSKSAADTEPRLEGAVAPC